jgi:hypothetical protein
MKNKLLWLLTPFLGDDNKPSIKRFLALFFAYEMHRVITTRPWDIYTVYILIVLGINIGIMIGIATYQTLSYFFKSNQNETNEKETK